MISRIFIGIILFTFVQCGLPAAKENPDPDNGEIIQLDFAENFEISDHGSYKILKIKQAWKESRSVFKYALYKKGTPKPELGKSYTYIEIPLKRVVCTSTTHLAMLNFLDETASIVGMSGTRFIYDEEVRKLVGNGQIQEIGGNPELNFEVLLKLNPEVVFTYGISEDNHIAKIRELGLTPVVLSEFMDQSPLGRAEWLRFLAEFFEKGDYCVKKLSPVVEKYLSAKALSVGKEKPTVMVGMGFEGSWYIPQGGSYVAQSIRDAGGEYLWKDQPGTISMPVAFEAAYERAVHADKWINVGLVNSLNDIRQADERYSLFKAWKEGEVYNGNARVSPGGGYDIYESATVRPDLVLMDLLKALHPDLLPDHEFVYYKRLE